VEAPVAPAQPRHRQQELDRGRDDDRDRVHVELRVDRVRARDADHDPGDDRDVPEDGRQRRDREMLVAVQDPDHDPRQPEQDDDREEHAREPDRQRLVAAGISERGDQPRREDDAERGQPAKAEQDQPEKARRDSPRPLALALLEQLAEHGHERRGNRGVREQRADEVRDLEGDRERVDPAARPEVVGGDDLADEAEHAGEPRCEREDRRRPGQPTARVSPVHVASIGRGPAVSGGVGGAAPSAQAQRRQPRRSPHPWVGVLPSSL
jgi:hypothetical protein